MPRGNKGTSEEELLDAVKRIGKKPDARRMARNSSVWYDYLIETLHIHPNAIESEAGKRFWENVRQDIREVVVPTKRQLTQANATVYTNPKTEQVSYRGANGRFVSAKAIASGDVIGF